MSELLTTSASVAQWIADADGNAGRIENDQLVTALIGQASRFILNYLSRPSLLPRVYSERYDGGWGTRLLLKNWPVLSISTLIADSTTIAAAAGSGKSGYLLTPWDGLPPGQIQELDLNGFGFTKGRQNVEVTYTAGYQVTAEPQVLPSGGAVTVARPYGAWASDVAVTNAGGVPFIKVAASPITGQYALGATPGAYTFAAADHGKTMLITYGYIPADIGQAATEIVGERYRYRRRIGEASKSIAGEVIAFSLKDMQDYVRQALQPYVRVAPV